MVTSNKDFIPAKIDPLFAEMIREVSAKRRLNKLDRHIKSIREQEAIRRYTKAMTRYKPLWQLLTEAEFKEELQ